MMLEINYKEKTAKHNKHMEAKYVIKQPINYSIKE